MFSWKNFLNSNKWTKRISLVKEYKIDNPLFTGIDSIGDECLKDCRNKNFHSFNHKSLYGIKLTKIIDNEIFNLTIGGKNKNCMI